MKPSEQAEMKEMKMTRNYCYGDIITILYKMSVGGGGGGAVLVTAARGDRLTPACASGIRGIF